MSLMKLTRRFTNGGAALVGYKVAVSISGTVIGGGNVPASLYADVDGVHKYPDNFLVTDANGEVVAYVNSGAYRLSLLAPGNLTSVMSVEDPVYTSAAGIDTKKVDETADNVVDYAYAAAITPACVAKHTIINVAALTGALTVNAPTNPQKGFRLTFMMLQDATGNRVTTWDAVFVKAADTATPGANLQGATSFIFNGTKWLQDGPVLTYR